MQFKKYVANNPIIDNRIILTGNRLSFIEPLEATAIQTYLQWARITYDWILLKNFSADEAVHKIKKYILEIENFIIWHYQFGSKYDTPFWDYAKTFTIEDPEFYKFLKYTQNIGDDWCDEEKNRNMWYGQWQAMGFHYWHEGVV